MWTCKRSRAFTGQMFIEQPPYAPPPLGAEFMKVIRTQLPGLRYRTPRTDARDAAGDNELGSSSGQAG